MGRSKKKDKDSGGTAAWLVTFSDMMTLLLTFFVLLLSMATLRDERKEQLALGSVQETFGMGKQTMSVLGNEETKIMLEPGPMTDKKPKELTPIKKKLWEDETEDLEFMSNKFVQIISIHSDLLFAPGETELSEKGKKKLAQIAPYFNELSYPVLLSGHTSIMLGEEKDRMFTSSSGSHTNPSWKISLYRVLSVYKYLLDQGVKPNRLRVEAFGKYKPRYSNKDREGRKKNRRVDIILDKRNYEEHIPNKLKGYAGKKTEKKSYNFRDFEFDIED